MKTVLLISAHPDDMEIGMGGTVAKLSESGHTIVSVILTDGRRSPNPFSISQQKMAEVRLQESKRAASVLGISETIFVGLESIAAQDHYATAIKKLKEILEAVKPEQIFTLHPELDRHPSHRLSGKVSLEALSDTRPGSAVEVWAYEVWGLFHNWDRFEDISDQIDRKLKAIGEHHSQVAAIPYAEGVAGLNRWRAIFADPQQTTVQAAFAEVFLKLK